MSSSTQKISSSLLELFFTMIISVFTLWVAGYVVVSYWDWFGGYVMQNPPHINHLAGSAVVLLVGLVGSQAATILLLKSNIKGWEVGLYSLFMWLIAYPIGLLYHWLLF